MKIDLLDTTLRDGGLGLEDSYLNCHGKESYRKDELTSIVESLTAANIDIIELGSIELSGEDKTRFSIFENVQEISKLVPKKHNNRQMFVALYRGPDTPISDIPERTLQMVDGVRVILRYSELEKSLKFCEALAKKGYKVFVQPMLTMRYSDDELEMIADYTNRMNAYALYFVDSYGYMMQNDVERLFRFFDKRLAGFIKIGFHAHNNLNLAFANAIYLLSINVQRDLIIDSCAIGMGQGAGNLQTELMANYLNENFGKQYQLNDILDVCDIVENKSKEGLWGYSVSRFLPAIHHAAYKYATVLRNEYNFSYRQINDFYTSLSVENKNRFTREALESILKNN